MTHYRFSVRGVPASQGSMTAMRNPRTGAVVVRHDSPKQLTAWRTLVALSAKQAGAQPLIGSVSVRAWFFLQRPQSHFRADGSLSTEGQHDLRPNRRGRDLDKLLRAVLDALTGVCWTDDAQVVEIISRKDWASSSPGADLEIVEYNGQGLGPFDFLSELRNEEEKS
jgi:Holliday junction resolvase RusA-like endonuclease